MSGIRNQTRPIFVRDDLDGFDEAGEDTRAFVGFGRDEWRGRMRCFPLPLSFPLRPVGVGSLRQQ
jgi:hypothetical protein